MPIPEENIKVTFTPAESAQVDVKDMIGHPPGWLLKSGIGMVAIVTTVILIGAYFFKYPDKLVGRGTLTSSTPPIEIVSRSNGYIERILLPEDSPVEKGESILFIDNTTDQIEINQIVDWISKYEEINNPKHYLSLEFVKNLQLGIIQQEYAQLQLTYNELQQNLKEVVVFQRINNIDDEIGKIKILNQSLENEKEIFAKVLDLSKKDYERNEDLKANGVISELDLEKAKSALLTKEREFEGMNNGIIQNSIRIEQLEHEKLKLIEDRGQKIKSYQFAIAGIIARIKSSVENWSQKYNLVAPIAGKLAFAPGISEKKNLTQGQVIGHILPNENQEKFVSAIFPSTNIGKVEVGQKTILKFDSYPHKEFGVVMSKVGNISDIPLIGDEGGQQYEIKIPISDVIITDYQDTLVYQPNMSMTIEIITENRTVLERVFDQFLSLLDQE